MFAAVTQSRPRTLNKYAKRAAELDSFIPSTDMKKKGARLGKRSLNYEVAIELL